MEGMYMEDKRQAAGAATGGVLRLAVAARGGLSRQLGELAGVAMQRFGVEAPRSTPPAAGGGTPLSEGGECLRATHSSKHWPVYPET